MTRIVGARRLFLSALLLGSLLRPAQATVEAPQLDAYQSGELTQRFFDALTAWDLEAAEKEWQAMLAASPANDVWPIYCEGVLRFYQSRYAESEARFSQLTDLTKLEEPLAKQVEFYRGALKVGLGFQRKESDHFIFHATAEDMAMAEYTLEFMERVREVIGKDLGWYPTEKVVIEAMPSRKAFDEASPLTRKEIDTSGTIALCKFNRLMFTSPRALFRGYGWMQTVAHEYVHYVISRKTRNRVPIWLHEGIARYEEGRAFKDERGHEPDTANVLAKALEEDYFVTFAQMSPSMAKLKSREDVRLAFAQVSHAFEWMLERKGYEGARDLLDRLTRDEPFEDALKKVYGMGLAEIETSLKGFLRKKGYKYNPNLEELPLTFKEDIEDTVEGAKADEESQATQSIAVEASRDLARVGDLLRERNLLGAAAIEYKKGVELAPMPNPYLANKLALTLMALDRLEGAQAALEPTLAYYPDYPSTLKRLGIIHAKLGRPEKARGFLEDALGQNPFDPATHETLVEVYTQLNLPALAEREKRILALLPTGP